MVKDLDHLLARDHFLHVGVQLAQAGLLAGVVGAAAPGGVVDVPEHGNVAHHDQQREPPVEHEQQKQRACDLYKHLNDHRKAVVQRVGNRVHIVGEQAHQIALAVRVKEVQGHRLQVGKQVAADFLGNTLRRADHELGVAQGGQRADEVDERRERHDPGQVGKTAIFQNAVDGRAYHVGANQGGQGADGRQHADQCQFALVVAEVIAEAAQGDDAEHDFVAAQIVHEAAQRVPQVLRALTAECFRHLRRPLSSGNCKFPDRSYPFSAVRHGCQRRANGRRPESR